MWAHFREKKRIPYKWVFLSLSECLTTCIAGHSNLMIYDLYLASLSVWKCEGPCENLQLWKLQMCFAKSLSYAVVIAPINHRLSVKRVLSETINWITAKFCRRELFTISPEMFGNFEFFNFNHLFFIFINMGPYVSENLKHYYSHSYNSLSTKLFLDTPCEMPHKCYFLAFLALLDRVSKANAEVLVSVHL